MSSVAWAVLGGLGACALLWAGLSVRLVLFPPPRTITPPQPLPAYLTHALTSPDGRTFEVWRLPVEPPRARVLLLHGYFANRFQVLGVAEALRRRGFETVLMELRGHGRRPGPCTLGVREVEDAGVVLRWMDALDPARPAPIALLGFSMGAAVGCQVAARYPQVRALVADSLYARLYPILAQDVKRRYHLPAAPFAWLTWGALHLVLRQPFGTLDPVTLAPAIRRPLLAIYGEADQRIRASLWREVVDRWAGETERWVLPGVAHVDAFAADPQRYGDRVAAFLEKALG